MARLVRTTTTSITVSLCFALLVASAAVIAVDTELDAAAATYSSSSSSSINDEKDSQSGEVARLYKTLERFRSLMSLASNYLELMNDDFELVWDGHEKDYGWRVSAIIDHMIAVADNVLQDMEKFRGEFFIRHNREEFMQCYNGFLHIISDGPRNLFSIIRRQFWPITKKEVQEEAEKNAQHSPQLILNGISEFFDLYSTYWPHMACARFYPRDEQR